MNAAITPPISEKLAGTFRDSINVFSQVLQERFGIDEEQADRISEKIIGEQFKGLGENRAVALYQRIYERDEETILLLTRHVEPQVVRDLIELCGGLADDLITEQNVPLSVIAEALDIDLEDDSIESIVARLEEAGFEVYSPGQETAVVNGRKVYFSHKMEEREQKEFYNRKLTLEQLCGPDELNIDITLPVADLREEFQKLSFDVIDDPEEPTSFATGDQVTFGKDILDREASEAPIE